MAGVARIVGIAAVVFDCNHVEGLMIVRTPRLPIDIDPVHRLLQCLLYSCAGLAEGRLTGEFIAHNQGVDLVGTFIGAHRFEIICVTQR